ncbi:MAG: SidE phosphodiesterase domain-containing protein [Gammaproteobacteria bacterium]|nr:SidE phosphodiesterase domain-containing protein [Gammaproteobacteria bacterium]
MLCQRYIDLYDHSQRDNREVLGSISITLRELAEDPSFIKKNKEDDVIAINNLRGALLTYEYLPKERHDLDCALILIEFLDDLKKDGDAYKIIVHMIRDIGERYYNLRESNLIEPDGFSVFIGRKKRLANKLWGPSLAEMLQRKKLGENLFDDEEKTEGIRLGDPLSMHVKWAFNHMYKVPYPKKTNTEEDKEEIEIARKHHGIQHVTRAAYYVTVLANLYKKHGDHDAKNLTDDDIKLMQIAMLFHDSAREADGEDKWDHESAILLYCYLTKKINVPHEKAKLIAEAVANKDPDSGKGYFELILNKDNEVAWTWSHHVEGKNIYQKIIHDADCLDIVRVRDHFDARYLDFYKEIASRPENNLAFDEMAELIIETRSLVDIQGDGYKNNQLHIKQQYEQENALQIIEESIQAKQKNKYAILNALGKKLLTTKELSSISLTDYDSPLDLALHEGQIIIRSINFPSKKTMKKRDGTLGKLEVRKVQRNIETPTATKKPNKYKSGNLSRSVTLAGLGAGVYGDAGFVLMNPDQSRFSGVSLDNLASGFGKKSHLKHMPRLSGEQYQIERDELLKTLKRGGSSTQYNKHITRQNELIYDVTRYDAVYYTDDPHSNDKHRRSHPNAHILQAIYLREAYKKQYEDNYITYCDEQKIDRNDAEARVVYEKKYGKSVLPIMYYSGIHNQVKMEPEENFTPENITRLWADMCEDYMKSLALDELTKIDLNEVKVRAMYHITHRAVQKDKKTHYELFVPADSLLSQEIQDDINEAIHLKKQAILIKKHQEFIDIITRKIQYMNDYKIVDLLSNDLKDDANDELVRIIRQCQCLTYLDNEIVNKFKSTIRNAIEVYSIRQYRKDIESVKDIMYFYNKLILLSSVCDVSEQTQDIFIADFQMIIESSLPENDDLIVGVNINKAVMEENAHSVLETMEFIDELCSRDFPLTDKILEKLRRFFNSWTELSLKHSKFCQLEQYVNLLIMANKIGIYDNQTTYSYLQNLPPDWITQQLPGYLEDNHVALSNFMKNIGMNYDDWLSDIFNHEILRVKSFDDPSWADKLNSIAKSLKKCGKVFTYAEREEYMESIYKDVINKLPINIELVVNLLLIEDHFGIVSRFPPRDKVIKAILSKNDIKSIATLICLLAESDKLSEYVDVIKLLPDYKSIMVTAIYYELKKADFEKKNQIYFNSAIQSIDQLMSIDSEMRSRIIDYLLSQDVKKTSFEHLAKQITMLEKNCASCPILDEVSMKNIENKLIIAIEDCFKYHYKRENLTIDHCLNNIVFLFNAMHNYNMSIPKNLIQDYKKLMENQILLLYHGSFTEERKKYSTLLAGYSRFILAPEMDLISNILKNHSYKNLPMAKELKKILNIADRGNLETMLSKYRNIQLILHKYQEPSRIGSHHQKKFKDLGFFDDEVEVSHMQDLCHKIDDILNGKQIAEPLSSRENIPEDQSTKPMTQPPSSAS